MNIFKKIKRFFSDTPDGYVKKPFAKSVDSIPPGSIIVFRGRGNFISYLIRKVEH
jgi:hypothetical protein